MLMGFEYTHDNINDIAEKCHKMMGLSSPVNLDDLKIAIQKSEKGDILDIHEIFHDIDILKSELKCCTDLDDIKHKIKNFIKATSDEYKFVNVYDFHKESMLHIHKECINPAYNMIYYIKIIKN